MKRTAKSNTNYILTNDPSMTGWGWAVLTPAGKVVDCGAIKTEPSNKKLGIRKGADRARRITEINSELLEVIEKYKIKLIISEQPHGSQSAVAAVMIGITAGIVQTMGDCLDIAVEWYSEGDAKKAISGKRSVGKDEMVVIAKTKFSKVAWRNVKWFDQAVADSLAVFYVASQQSALIKFNHDKQCILTFPTSFLSRVKRVL